MKRLLLAGLAASIGFAAWTGVAGAQLLSSTGPVIAILDGELLVGEATGNLGGWGTIALPPVLGTRANVVRVLHADGSMAIYAHLRPESVVIQAGRHVYVGQKLGESGNTGFS